jgi:hypothetical protein
MTLVASRWRAFRCTEEEITLYMDDGDGSILPRATVSLSQIPLFVELILN